MVFLIISPALARECYSRAEVQAEQTLRLHSQLMVIAISCNVGSGGQDLVGAYEGFTHDNIDLLQKAEHTLLRYYKLRYHGDGIAHLDDLRTKLGNEAAQEIADITVPEFCRQYQDRVTALYYDSPTQVRDEIHRIALAQKSYNAPCQLASSTRVDQVAKQTQ